MATFQPPMFRDFGGPITAMWQCGQYVLSATPVSVHAYPGATYASAGAGVESVDIDIDALGVVSIPSIGTETSAADWVTTINTAYFAAFGVNPAFVDLTGNLALQATTSIAVSNYLDAAAPPGDAAFGVIGLPVVFRDNVAAAIIQPDRAVTLMGVSQPIDVPRGANVVGVTPIFVGGDASIEAAIAWGLLCNDPTSTDPILVFGAEGLAFVDGTFGEFGTGAPYNTYVAPRLGLDDLFKSQTVISAINAALTRYEFRIPATDGQLRLWAACSLPGASAPLPQTNPTMQAIVRFSAR